MRRFAHTLFLVVIAIIIPHQVFAQFTRKLLPAGELMPTISADPREPSLGGRVILVNKGASLFGTGLEGEADIGKSLPFVILGGSDPEDVLLLGLQGGIFGRFTFSTKQKDLISTDWVFGLPLILRRGKNWYRLRYRHMSSHLGDEYQNRFDVERSGYSRDQLGLTVYRHIGKGFSMYGGGNVAFNVEPDPSDRIALNAGFELIGKVTTQGYKPFLGVDVYIDQDSSWKPRVNVQTGMIFFPNSDRRLKFIFEFLGGPSPQGEFHKKTVSLATLGLHLEL